MCDSEGWMGSGQAEVTFYYLKTKPFIVTQPHELRLKKWSCVELHSSINSYGCFLYLLQPQVYADLSPAI